MVTVNEVPPTDLISALRDELEESYGEVEPEQWGKYRKTGKGRKRPPDDADWWYTRAASILRKVYLNEPIGVARLRKEYGAREDMGVAPEHSSKAGGSNIRKILQQLEDAGLITTKDDGRHLTPNGRGLLDRLSTDISKQMDVDPWYAAFEEEE